MRADDAREVLLQIFNEVNNNSDCTFPYVPENNDTDEDWYYDYDNGSNINFAFRGVGVFIFSLFGITVNVLSVIVLTNPKLKSTFTILLLGLTISDIFMMGTHFLFLSLHAVLNKIGMFPFYFSHMRPYLFPYIFPIGLTAQMSSIYFTVGITLERYIAVCHPLKARSLCTRSAANRSFFIIVLVSILYNIPRWFKYSTVPITNCDNSTVMWYVIRDTEFGASHLYMFYYYFWGYSIVYFVIPFILLVYFNYVIYKVVRKQRSLRSALSSMKKDENNEDIQLAVMLLGIVITFLICYVLNLVDIVMISLGLYFPGDMFSIANFLEIFSHSSNFVFYCAFGTRFRRQLRKTLGMKETPKKSEVQRNKNSESDSGVRKSSSEDGNELSVSESYISGGEISNSSDGQINENSAV